jgi:hypothetical protein
MSCDAGPLLEYHTLGHLNGLEILAARPVRLAARQTAWGAFWTARCAAEDQRSKGIVQAHGCPAHEDDH